MTTGPLEKEEEKDEQAVGRTVMLAWHGLLKSPKAWALLALLLGGGGVYREFTREPKPVADAFTKDELQQIVRQEIKREVSPVRAGLEELAKATSAQVQVRVLSAMIRAERRATEGVQ